jgi:hypothetical protein
MGVKSMNNSTAIFNDIMMATVVRSRRNENNKKGAPTIVNISIAAVELTKASLIKTPIQNQTTAMAKTKADVNFAV